MARTVQRSWVWHFDHPPEAVWPLLADTPHLNEAVGVPKYQLDELIQPGGSVLRLARTKRPRQNLEWEERPFQWVTGRTLSQERRFHKGPLRRLGLAATLAPEGTGSRVLYTLEAEPASLTGRALLLFGFLERAGRAMERAARALEAASADTPTPTAATVAATAAVPAPGTDPTRALRVEGMVAAIESGGNGHGLARRLAELVLTGPETDLGRLRPLALARSWGVAPRHTVETCLAAVKAGLLAMSWDILCPRCRGPKAAASSLDRLPRGVHCPSCNVPYDADFSRNVELTFHPAPAVRPVTPGGFCLSGPGVTPHVAVQQTLAPGERRLVEASLPAGCWRLRTLEPGGSCDLDGPEPGAGLPTLVGDGATVSPGPPAPDGQVAFENRSERELTFVVEDRRWIADALTAHHVTTLEAFRELFSDAVLRPGDEVAIAHVTLMFTDLKASTALYGRIGDAGAYQLVRNHFAFLAGQVRSHDGCIVKTIGDAVMAAFHDPEQAAAAAIAIQHEIARVNQTREPDQRLVIKLGLHGGPCVAVTLNGRLDYFGSTVNLAARLQSESTGGDLVVSAALSTDPGVATQLTPLAPALEWALVKGFPEPIRFLRVPASAFAAPAATA